MNTIKTIEGWKVMLPAIEHRGWLPPGRTKSLREPARETVMNLSIEAETDSFVLVRESADGSVYGDDWYPTLDAALAAAVDRFGVPPTAWTDT